MNVVCCVRKVCFLMLICCLTLSGQAVIIDENFTGGSLEQLGWYNKDGGWSVNNVDARAEFNGSAANGWQWIGKTFDSAAVTNGWQLDFDYEWHWGDHASALQFRADIVGAGSNYESANGYGLIVHQGGENSFQLVRLDSGSYVPGTVLGQGNGYNDSGCQWSPPVWKSVRLTWDANTNTLKAYKKVNGAFVEVASAVDATYSSFSNLHFNELQTYGEGTWITNVKFSEITCFAPVVSPAGSYINGPTEVTLSSLTAGATIYYTTNGDTPTTGSTRYTGPVTVENGTVLNAIAVKSGYLDSAVTRVAYRTEIISENFSTASFGTGTYDWKNKECWTINNSLSRVEYNVSAASGWQWFEKSFDSSLLTKGWELDFDYEWQWGSTSSALRFQAEVVASGDLTSASNGYALLVRQGGDNSFELQRLSSDGSAITIASGNGYSDSGCQFGSPVWKTVKLTWNAATHTFTAYKMVNETYVEVLSYVDSTYSDFGKIRFNEIYTAGENNWITNVHFSNLTCSLPAFSPAGPEISGATEVTISSATEGAKIYYTINGDTPAINGMGYTSPTTVTINLGDTLKAIAIADGYSASDMNSQTYYLRHASAPTFKPGGPYISGPTAITLQSVTPGASIYYTLNGGTPSVSSTRYTAPITVHNGDVLRAITVASGYSQSDVSSLTFSVPATYNDPQEIPYGSAVIDGSLSDWAGASWAALDVVPEIGTAEADVQADVPAAYYAARWQANKIYVAVKVQDTGKHFTDTYTAWNARDAIEVFVHTDNNGGTDYSSRNTLAQQYEFGFKTDATNLWAYVGANGAYDLSSSSDVAEAAGQITTDGWLYYEIALTPYTYFGLLETGNMTTTMISNLVTGEVIGLDVEVISNNIEGTYLGKKSENNLIPKWNNWTNIGLHVLGRIPGDANGDGLVNVSDLSLLAANYGTTSGATWGMGDFTGDGAVNVSDLSLLAANYGTGSSSTVDYAQDYASVFGSTTNETNDDSSDDIEDTSSSICSSLGLSLIAGLAMMGLMIVKMDE